VEGVRTGTHSDSWRERVPDKQTDRQTAKAVQELEKTHNGRACRQWHLPVGEMDLPPFQKWGVHFSCQEINGELRR